MVILTPMAILIRSVIMMVKLKTMVKLTPMDSPMD